MASSGEGVQGERSPKEGAGTVEKARGGRGTDAFATPPRTAFGWSAAVHIAAILIFWLADTARPNPPEFVSYEIEIVSPPSSVEGEPVPEEELTVETPEESQPEPEPEEEPPPPPESEEEALPVEEPEPEPVEEEPEPEPTTPSPDEETPPPPPEEVEDDVDAGVANPEEEVEATGEDINVRMEGLRRDYPAYYNNIIRQIQRCFRPPPGDYQATVRFYIEREGTVSDLSVVEPSGSFQFDMEAMGAAECAGTGGRLGPLPADLPFERLPIEFEFQPAGGG